MHLPVLTILCGVPAVGKSTFAKNFLCKNPSAVHLTSDGIRKELYGAEAILGDRSKVFDLMVQRTVKCLSDGKDVLYDSTALERCARDNIISRCPACVRINCMLLWAPREVCIARDAARERTVGPAVIDLLTGTFEAPFYDERFSDICFRLPDDFDREAYEQSKDLPPEDKNISDPDVRFAARCIAGGISPWEAIGLPDATPFGVWLISAHKADDAYREKLPPFLKNILVQLSE